MADLVAVVKVRAEYPAGSWAEEADLVGDLCALKLAATDLVSASLVYRTEI